MAITGDFAVDRIRSILARVPFEFTEAEVWESFDYQPQSNADRVFRVLPPASQSVSGKFDYAEDRVDSVQILVGRQHNGDWNAVRKTLTRDMHSITAAVVRDDSGEFSVPDEGRGHAIAREDSTATYVVLRLTLPIFYEAQL
jgi:hypothetical protein